MRALKISLLRVSAFCAVTVTAMSFGLSAVADDGVHFADSRLQACVETALGVDPGTPVSATDIASLTQLSCDNYYTSDFAPLQYATGLESLHLTYGPEALAPYLPAMTHLSDLNIHLLAAQEVVDALSGLTELRSVKVPIGVTDLTPLSGLSHLESLSVFGAQQVRSLTALEGLTSLRHLDVDQTWIDSIEPIAGLHGLESLDIAFTYVEDLSPLSGLTNLTTLSADCWPDMDPTPVKSLINLTTLSLPRCGINDANFFAGMTKLQTLNADYNALSDLTPLADLADLETLSATHQTVVTPDVAVCVPHQVPTPLDIDGSAVHFTYNSPVGGTSAGVFNDGYATWVRANYDNVMNFVTEGNNFTGTVTERSTGSDPVSCLFDSAPSIAISGDLSVGSTLGIQQTGTWSPYPAGWTDVWWTSDGVGVSTEPTYVVTPSDAGHDIKVRVRGNRPGFEVKTVISAPASIPAAFDPNWKVTFLNPPLAGFTADVDRLWDLPNAQTSCAWYIDGHKVATNSTCEYLLPSSTAGKQLKVRVTASRAGYVPATYESASTLILRYYAPLWITMGKISGTPDVGKVLTVTPTTYKPAATSYTYQWTRNDDPIPGATGKTYTPSIADAGQLIFVWMTAHRAGYAPAADRSVGVRIHRLFTTKPVPTISGTLASGHTLTAHAGTWSPSATLKYQWYRAGKAISGATHSTYKTTSTDGGHTLTVHVTGTRSGYTTAMKYSSKVMVLKSFKTVTPTISGTAAVKHTLTAHRGTWSPTPSYGYQWYRNGKAISGATHSTYKVNVRDAYASITVKVTGKKSGYLTASKTSTAKKPAGIKYASCISLRADYPGGVAKSSSTQNEVGGVSTGGILSTTYVSSTLYSLNAARDGDKDGWACE